MAGFNFAGTQLGDFINSSNTDWSGVFGRNTQNAPLNDAFQFPSIPQPQLNREATFQQNEREAALAGQRATQQTVGGAQQLANTASGNYQQKADIDYQQAVRLANMPRSGGSAAIASNLNSGFGQWGAPSQMYGMMGGTNLAADNQRRIEDARYGREFAAQSARMISQAEAAGDIARTRAQANAQRQLLALQNSKAIDLARSQASIANQQSAIDFQRQAQEAARQRTSNERLASIQATGNIYGSMFGALSAPGANYRYWN